MGVTCVDHVTLVTTDGEAMARRFRERHGLGSFGGAYLDHLGAWTASVPLTPPQYLEWLTVDDRAVAGRTDTGRRILAAADAGVEVTAWTVLVDDVEAAARRVGVDVFEGTTRTYQGLVRKWWTVTGPPHLPIMIQYEGPEEARLARWEGAFERAGHVGDPGGFTRIEVGGTKAELDDWLGPHGLPVAFVEGPPGIQAAHIQTARGPLVLRNA